jgi:hypothetical protein
MYKQDRVTFGGDVGDITRHTHMMYSLHIAGDQASTVEHTVS